MSLIVLSRVVPGWPLVVAGNRDEAYARPAAPLGRLREEPPTLGSRDLLAGGTALAVSAAGVVAGLTNQPQLVSGTRDPTKRSRGELPLLLTATARAVVAVAAFTGAAAYNPCWMLSGDRDTLHHLDLTRSDVPPRALPPGVHVLENTALGAPSAKVEHVRAALARTDLADADAVDAMLRTLLADHALPPGGRSPIAACCVHTEQYGTRSAMLVRVPAERDAPPEVWGSDGPSCVNPLVRAAF